jgi:iron complex outermembrane receptor protein
MNKNLLSTSSLCALSLCLLYSTNAHAQAVDYGSLEELFGEPVTTSATGTPQRVSEAPANMTIITADEIRQSGSRNIPEILSRVPGLDILESSANVYDVGVRGYQQPFQSRLLVLVDGRQVFIDDYSRTIWDNIPVNIDDIRQIEVVKGAASALFGSNAAGGVINIVTYSPLYDDNNVASVTAGTQSTFSGDGTATVKGDWGGTKTSVGGMNANSFSTGREEGYDAPSQYPYHGYFSNNSVIKLAPKLMATTEANYSASAGTTDDFIDNMQSAGQKTSTYSVGAGLIWDSPFGQISNNNYLNHSYVELDEAPTDDGAPYGLTTDLFVSQLQDQFKVGSDNTFRTALEYRYKDFKNDGEQLVPQAPALQENTFALSGTWLWQITDRLSLTNAARVDHQELGETGSIAPGQLYSANEFNRNITTFTSNSDIVYKATDNDSFRIGYGRGVQLPSFLQYGFTQLYSFSFPNQNAPGLPGAFCANAAECLTAYEGNPTLKPTYTQDYSADYDRRVSEIYSHLKFSLYYEINQDIVAPFVLSSQVYNSSLCPGNANYGLSPGQCGIYTSGNVGNSSGWGGEFEIKGSHPLGFRWDASYSYSRVSDSTLVYENINYQDSAPEHHFRLLLGYTTGPWELDANGQLVTSTDMFRGYNGGYAPTYNSGYTSLSGRIGYKITDNITFAVSGTNLNQSTVNVSPYPAIERQIFATLTAKF